MTIDAKEYLTEKSKHDKTDKINNLLIKSGLVDVAAIVAKELAAKDDERLTIAANYEAVIAAKDRIIEAKDAEIARLKRENFDLNGCLLTEQELAEKRDALIRSLADALNSYIAYECIDCGAKCEGDGACVHQKNLRSLVANAREVVK